MLDRHFVTRVYSWPFQYIVFCVLLCHAGRRLILARFVEVSDCLAPPGEAISHLRTIGTVTCFHILLSAIKLILSSSDLVFQIVFSHQIAPPLIAQNSSLIFSRFHMCCSSSFIALPHPIADVFPWLDSVRPSLCSSFSLPHSPLYYPF